MRNLYNLKGEENNPRRSSAPQHETKKSRKNLLLLFALLLLAMGLGNGKAYAAVTELPLDDNWGNTVYFTITDHTHHYVEYVCPNENNVSWDGFDKPQGILDLPGTFDYGGGCLYCDFHWQRCIQWMLGCIRGNHPQHRDSNQ